MTRRRSYKDLLGELERKSHEADVLSYAVNTLLHWPEKIKHFRGKQGYSAKVLEVTAPHGGIILATWAGAGQRPYTSAHYLEKWLSEEYDMLVSLPLGKDPEMEARRELLYEIRRFAQAANEAARVAGGRS